MKWCWLGTHHYHVMGAISFNVCGDPGRIEWECCNCGKRSTSRSWALCPGYPRNTAAGSASERFSSSRANARQRTEAP